MNSGDSNAECVDHLNSYSCRCKSGYKGQFCEVEIDECESRPCHNDGTCIDKIAGFECVCNSGFVGWYCETNQDDCNSFPCKSGECKDGVNYYRVVLLERWVFGKKCFWVQKSCFGFKSCFWAKKSDFSTKNNPPFSGISSKTTFYSCTCPLNFGGRNCDTRLNPCDSIPCQAGSTCNYIPETYKFECICQPGKTGKLCQTDINECESSPCLNSGSCLNGLGNYECVCNKFFEGLTCQHEINMCASHPCQNSGTCSFENLVLTCACKPGFYGVHCEFVTDSCNDGFGGYVNPCENGACTDMLPPETFICICAEGWTGDYCEVETDECACLPCLNGGQCLDGENIWACYCGGTGFTGMYCETDINECEIVVFDEQNTSWFS